MRKGKINITHGMSYTSIYKTWQHIKDRCFNPENSSFENYGARGIGMYKDWVDDFQLFYDHVSKLENFNDNEVTLDRDNNDLGYFPENLRWATTTEQANNRRVFKNSTTGVTGVSWNQKNSNYVSYIKHNYKRVHLGSFKTIGDAVNVRNQYIMENKLSHKIQIYCQLIDIYLELS